MSHDVDVLLQKARSSNGISIPEGWGQGRAIYGGVVAGALVARALGELGADEITLRSMTTNFLAPVTPGPTRLAVDVLRQGKSATQAEVRMFQKSGEGESVVAVALVTLGAERESEVEVVPRTARPAVSFDDAKAVPFVEGMSPDFMAHTDLRPVTGNFPFSGADFGDLTGYMRFKNLTETFDLPHLVAIIDAWPPAPGAMLSKVAPMSTMTWTLEFTGPVPNDPATAWWYEVVTDAAHHGYGHTGARIYDGDGRLVAISRQTVAVFG